MAIMDFPRPNTTRNSPPLLISSYDHYGDPAINMVTRVQAYKYLGVPFDPKLKWQVPLTNVIARAACWAQQLWRVTKTVGGLSPNKTRQLYRTVAIPALTYTSDIWYIPPFKTAHSPKSYRSVKDTQLLCLIQGMATRYITGGIRDTAFDVLEAHANIPPIDLTFRIAQFHTASRISAIPLLHPLYPVHALSDPTTPHCTSYSSPQVSNYSR